ncbi:MAG: hypothetical protein ACK55I_06525, partial [bacterium]
RRVHSSPRAPEQSYDESSASDERYEFHHRGCVAPARHHRGHLVHAIAPHAHRQRVGGARGIRRISHEVADARGRIGQCIRQGARQRAKCSRTDRGDRGCHRGGTPGLPVTESA